MFDFSQIWVQMTDPKLSGVIQCGYFEEKDFDTKYASFSKSKRISSRNHLIVSAFMIWNLPSTDKIIKSALLSITPYTIGINTKLCPGYINAWKRFAFHSTIG